jgi:hypothetical protein
MQVELLFWDGCPSHPRALADLRAAMADLGLDPSAVALREIDTDEQAMRERFAGSPTIRIGGVDVQPTGEEPYGLTCRVYHRRDGRVSPTPDPADVREALLAATIPGDASTAQDIPSSTDPTEPSTESPVNATATPALDSPTDPSTDRLTERS